jgi:hypothetical protein
VFVSDAVIWAEAPAHFSRSEVEGSWLDRYSTSIDETISDAPRSTSTLVSHPIPRPECSLSFPSFTTFGVAFA